MSIIRRANIQEQIDNARADERDMIERHWRERMNNEIERLQGKYDLKVMELQAEIKSLQRIRDENEKEVKIANEKLKQAEQMVLMAQQEISRCDMAVKRHAEQTSLVFTEITDVKHRITLFVKKNLLLEEK